MGTDAAVAAYGARAQEYADAFGSMEDTALADREVVEAWAIRCTGPVVDLGCGPGHWTAWLHGLGHDVVGVDPTPEFVEIARAAHDGADFRVGTFDGIEQGCATGVLAWYSLIHLEPAEVPAALARIRDVLRPGGRVLLGFFDGERVEPFEHAVTRAWFWPVGEMSRLLEEAGFTVERTHQRPADGSTRAHGAIEAVRAD